MTHAIHPSSDIQVNIPQPGHTGLPTGCMVKPLNIQYIWQMSPRFKVSDKDITYDLKGEFDGFPNRNNSKFCFSNILHIKIWHPVNLLLVSVPWKYQYGVGITIRFAWASSYSFDKHGSRHVGTNQSIGVIGYQHQYLILTFHRGKSCAVNVTTCGSNIRAHNWLSGGKEDGKAAHVAVWQLPSGVE